MGKTRKQHIEEIMEHLYSVRRKFSSQWLAHSKEHKDEKMDIPSSQWMALIAVFRKENVSISELAETLGVTSSATTQLVNELVAKGYLLRKEKADDRRTLMLSLSEGAKKKIHALKARQMDKFQYMFDGLTDKELEQYVALNKKISDHVLQK